MKKIYLILIILIAKVTYAENKVDTWLKSKQIKIAKSSLPNALVLIGRDKNTIEKISQTNNKFKPTENSLFDLASLSKVITSLALHVAIERYNLSLNSSVGDILKYDQGLAEKFPTTYNLLKQHTLGELLHHQSILAEIYESKLKEDKNLSLWGNVYKYIGDKGTNKVCWATKDRKAVPSSKKSNIFKFSFNQNSKPYCYKDINYMIIGRVIEVVSNMKLAKFYEEFIFKPLGLNYKYSFYEFVPASKQIYALSKEKHETTSDTLNVFSQMIPSYERVGVKDLFLSDQDTIFKNLVHDPKVKIMGNVSGHAGVISSAKALKKIIEVFLESRKVEDNIIKAKDGYHSQLGIPFKSIFQIYASKSEHGRGLGVDISSKLADAPSGRGAFGQTSFGHTGYTGTSFWVNACTGFYVIMLGNRTHIKGQPKSINYQRRTISQRAVESYDNNDTQGCRYERDS